MKVVLTSWQGMWLITCCVLVALIVAIGFLPAFITWSMKGGRKK